MVIPLLRYRGLIWRNTLAEMRHRYAGTGLGFVWNVLHPLALIVVYTFVFAVIMPGARVRGLPQPLSYLLYLCAGLLPWLAFAECITRSATAFSDNAAYLRKLPIPEPVFVAQAAASATMGLAISFAVLLVLSPLAGLRPTAWWLLLPVPLLALQALGFAVGFLCGTINVFFRDVGQILTVALQVVMWTVPVVYTTAPPFPAKVLEWLRWHPVMPTLSAVRKLFLYGGPPSAFEWAAMFVWPTVVLALAAFVFGRLRPEIRDVL